MSNSNRPKPTSSGRPISPSVPSNRMPALVPGSNRPKFIAIGAVVVLGALGVLAIILSRSSSDTKVRAQMIETSAVTVTGPTLPVMNDAAAGTAADPALGQVAPRLAGQSFDGAMASVEPGSGPMLVVFVAHWCPHCQREVPKIAGWAPGGSRNGVAIRAVATGTSKDLPNYPPSAWLTNEKFDVPTMVDDADGTAANAYGLNSFPYFVALDAGGKVVARGSGELTVEQFDALLALTKK
jgi:thiol-disulfide isomerase/thioredoxin